MMVSLLLMRSTGVRVRMTWSDAGVGQLATLDHSALGFSPFTRSLVIVRVSLAGRIGLVRLVGPVVSPANG